MAGFALREGGLLFLGSAENLDRKSSGFRVTDADHRIYTRTSEASPAFTHTLAIPAIRPEQPTRTGYRSVRSPGAPDSSVELRVKLLTPALRHGGRAFLALDDEHRLIEVVGDVGAYCRVAEGRMTGGLVSFLRPELQEEARALLLLSRADPQPVVGQAIRLNDLDRVVRLVATRIQVDESIFTMLAFEPDINETALPNSAQRSEDFDTELRRLEHELLVSQDTLRRSLVELQAVNEELQASNEELQATNEELGSLNQELAQRGDDLQVLNIDLKNIQDSLSQGMVIVDRALEVVRFTPLAVKVFALIDSDIGRPLLSTPTTLVIPGFEAALRAVVEGGPRVSIEAGDDRVSYLVQVLPYRAPDRTRLGAIITLTDVSDMVDLRNLAEQAFVELKAKSELLAHESTFDSVTGLLNRGHFAELLALSISAAERSSEHLALVWVDLDKFKEVNDEYGHNAGDVTLHVVGQRIMRSVRAADPVGRLGGDEIGVLISGFDTTAELDIILERIVASARELVMIDGSEVRTTVSVGVALFPEDAANAKDLMNAADAAMYSVKRKSGDDFAYFAESMNAAAAVRRVRRHEIEEAILTNAFAMHYQPVVDAHTGAVWGVEALVRWRRGDEFVPAADFVPFCEESGQIRALGPATIDLVRADVTTLRDAGHPDLRVSVNMSVTQLEDNHLADLLMGLTAHVGLRGIVVEILESVFLPDHTHALRMLEVLSGLGAETAVDDYGSGFSNVRLLESLDPDYIKLDRSFLSEHHTSVGRATLVRSAIEVSHVVGAMVIAEGIETEEQHQLVREAGVDFVQGFGVARPMPLDELIEWLSSRASGV